ncbi:MAG: glycosyltransferase family 87 protein [Vicinamibacterales bacterium]
MATHAATATEPGAPPASDNYIVGSPRHHHLTARRIQRHLVVLAAILWATAIAAAVIPHWPLATDRTQSADFLHFYTLARVGLEHRGQGFADIDVQRDIQLHSKPDSKDDWFPPVYGPQVALALAPLAMFPYRLALGVWIAVTLALYFALLWKVIQASPELARYRTTAMIAALAFPPFWELIVHGQISIVAVAIAVATWAALRHGHSVLAGAALGLLAFKPSLAVPVLLIVAAARCWQMVGAALVTAAAQILLAAAVVGRGALADYARMLAQSRQFMVLLAGKPYQMHSWRAFWLLLSGEGRLSTSLYLASSVVTGAVAVVIWRRTNSASIRMSALMLGAVLCAPHLYVYDLVVLAPVWVWLTEWYLSRRDLRPFVGWLLYAGYLAPLLGPALTRLTHIQVSTLLFAALLLCVWRYDAGGHRVPPVIVGLGYAGVLPTQEHQQSAPAAAF